MPYRQPEPPPVSPELAELDDYERELRRRDKRKRMVVAFVIGGMALVGTGSCVGPVAITIASDVWHARKTKLTSEEQQHVTALLDPIEQSARKSQAAFEAIWPKVRDSEVGARKDLGVCRVRVPGPRLKTKDESRALDDSANAYGWIYVDRTPPEQRSPIGALKMPRGSIALNNTGAGDRFVLPHSPLNIASPDKAPALQSTASGAHAAKLRAEAADGIRADSHRDYVRNVDAFASDALTVDVIVFLDAWKDPKMTNEMSPEPPPPKDDLDTFVHPARPRSQLFESGYAIAHAVAWDPTKQQVVCASQAIAVNSEHLNFKVTAPADDLPALRQDLILELEAALQRSFVAAGDSPPKLERPARLAP